MYIFAENIYDMITGKINEIPLTGLTSTLSDYDSRDGDLQICHNLVNNGAGLQGLQTAEKMKIEVDGEEVDINYETFMGGDQTLTGVTFKGLIFEHKTSNGIILIGIGSDTYLYWYDKNAAYTVGSVQKKGVWKRFYNQSNQPISFNVDSNGITSIGNMLILNLSNGLHYIRYIITSGYKYLGQSLPDLGWTFQLDTNTTDRILFHTGYKKDTNEYKYSNWDSCTCTEENHYKDPAYLNIILSQQNSILADIHKAGLFARPFFALLAYRMYDGSYYPLTSPVMLVPESGINPLTILISVETAASSTTFASGSSLHLLKSAVNISDWEDVIQSVEIFVSKEIVDISATGSEIEHIKGFSSDIDSEDGGCISSGTKDSNHFTNHFNIKQSIVNANSDNSAVTAIMKYTKGFKRNGSLKDWVEQTYNFYKVREIPFEEISSSTSSLINVIPTDDKVLLDLESRQMFTYDAYEPRSIVKADHINVYNRRLNLANVEISERSNYPFGSISGMTETNSSTGINAMRVYIEEEGCMRYTTIGVADIYKFDSLAGYFFYPNANAKFVSVQTRDGSTRYIKLRKHPYMNGAYAFSNWLSFDTTSQAPEIVSKTVAKASHPNAMYTSQVDNPFIFPAKGVNEIGNGEIMAIQTATKAMSEGTAFGAHPLYAFSTDGVYPVALGAEGWFERVSQPTAREVPLSKNGILNIDNSVIFLSGRGLMEINGGRTNLLSADLQAEHPTVIAHEGLPKWYNIHNKFFGESHSYLEAYNFMDYISNARLAFDYIHYRIYVYDPDKDVAFVYNIGTKTWSTCDNNFRSSVQGYPATIVNMTVSGNIVIGEFTQSGTDLVGDGKGLYLTRPIKFKEPDVYKTVRKIKERGIIKSGNDKYLCLYGSDDMLNWTLLAAKVGDEIPRLSGKPYKYFAVAGWSELDYKRNVVSRLSIEMKEKYTNKIR